MDYLLPLADPIFHLVYVPVVTFAVLVFLVFYIIALVTQARKTRIVEPVSLPIWLNVMYPSWLDKLTFMKIVTAFAWGLTIATISWIVVAVTFLAILSRAYGP